MPANFISVKLKTFVVKYPDTRGHVTWGFLCIPFMRAMSSINFPKDSANNPRNVLPPFGA